MPFSSDVAAGLLVRAARCCCVCHTFKGSKMEIHHMVQEADGGSNTEDNGIPLCFDCHAEVNAYNNRHPRGRKYTPAELRSHRDEWFAVVASGGAVRMLAFNRDVRRDFVARLDERISEGEALLGAIQTIPGQWREKWIKLRDDDSHFRTPDEYIVPYQPFVQWAVGAAALGEELAAGHPPLSRRMAGFSNVQCSKIHLEWGLATLRAVRNELQRGLAGPAPDHVVVAQHASLSTVSVQTAGVIAAGDVHINGDVLVKNVLPPKMKAAIIPGTVSEDPRMIGYLRYLIERYHEFKKWECDQRGEKMNYAVIHVAYKRELKYEVKHTPRTLFVSGVQFLQRRVERTIVGKTRIRGKQAVYSSFDDFDLPSR